MGKTKNTWKGVIDSATELRDRDISFNNLGEVGFAEAEKAKNTACGLVLDLGSRIERDDIDIEAFGFEVLVSTLNKHVHSLRSAAVEIEKMAAGVHRTEYPKQRQNGINEVKDQANNVISRSQEMTNRINYFYPKSEPTLEKVDEEVQEASSNQKPEHPQAENPDSTEIEIFISHSSKDKDIAKEIIDFLRDALPLKKKDIRCTSVRGYTFSAGVSIEERVKRETFSATILIGLLTPNSLRSTWVLYELGARWGAGRRMIPVLAKGATMDDLDGPLPGYTTLDSSNEDDLHQLVGNLSEILDCDHHTADEYRDKMDKVLELNASAKSELKKEDQAEESAALQDEITQLKREKEKLEERLVRPVEDLNLVLDGFADQQDQLHLHLDNQGGTVTNIEIKPQYNTELVTYNRKHRWRPTVGAIVFKHNPLPPEKPQSLKHFTFIIMYTDSGGRDWTKSYIVRINRKDSDKTFVREEDTVAGRKPDYIDEIVPPPAEFNRSQHADISEAIGLLNARQRYALARLCDEFQGTGKPVLNDRVYNELYWPSTQLHGSPPPRVNEIDDLLDVLEMKGLIRRLSHSVLPGDALLQYVGKMEEE